MFLHIGLLTCSSLLMMSTTNAEVQKQPPVYKMDKITTSEVNKYLKKWALLEDNVDEREPVGAAFILLRKYVFDKRELTKARAEIYYSDHEVAAVLETHDYDEYWGLFQSTICVHAEDGLRHHDKWYTFKQNFNPLKIVRELFRMLGIPIGPIMKTFGI